MLKIRRAILLLTVFLLLCDTGLKAQEEKLITFMFYNVENLFDLEDDPATSDEEFTPDGNKKWTSDRYYDKLEHIAKVMTGIGEWKLPEIVGLCEVENLNVLKDLVNHRLLAAADYRIIHQDSPDGRGIDVALLYDNSVLEPLHTEWIKIDFPGEPEQKTRDILYVCGRVYQLDTLHIFINHWPSRWGGVEATIPKRVYVASVLKSLTDSLFAACIAPNILIAGDFNDNPIDSSVLKVLQAIPEVPDSADYLVNPMYTFYDDPNTGTLKYKGDWDVFDQIIYSPACKELEHLCLLMNGPFIYGPPYLFTDDDRYLGKKPFRTYSGPLYLGGFSDHLPVYIRFVPCAVEGGSKY